MISPAPSPRRVVVAFKPRPGWAHRLVARPHERQGVVVLRGACPLACPGGQLALRTRAPAPGSPHRPAVAAQSPSHAPRAHTDLVSDSRRFRRRLLRQAGSQEASAVAHASRPRRRGLPRVAKGDPGQHGEGRDRPGVTSPPWQTHSPVRYFVENTVHDYLFKTLEVCEVKVVELLMADTQSDKVRLAR